jgi:hypothetical protein
MRLGAIGIVSALVVAFTAYDQYDKKTNYQPVDARVSAVNHQCYMEKTERGAVTKTTSTSDLLPCEVAAKLTREHPKWQGYEIRHTIEVQFAYVSPVDGKTHASSLKMSALPDGKPLQAGDVLRVLASKTKADQMRPI